MALSDLLVPVTDEEALDFSLDVLDTLGFNVTSWQSGSVQRTLVHLGAKIYASLSVNIAQIAAGGFNRLASSGWLDLLSEDFFDNTRVAALKTQGIMRLTASATAPPVTFAVGDLQIADTATSTASTNTFRNTTGGSLAPGGSLDLEFEAEVAGADGNITTATTLYMWTSYVGVTATNPAIGTTGTWITRAGTDEETDTRLQARNTSKWSTLSYAAVDGAYKAWALAADSSVTRVKVRSNNPYGAGSVDVVCATDVGTISAAQAADILDYINGVTDDVGRRPLGDVVSVTPASTVALTVSGTVTVDAGYTATTTAAVIQDAILAVIDATDIGGTIIPPASTGVLVFSKLVAAVEALDGVIAFTPTAPTANVALTELQIIPESLVNFSGLTVVYG